MTMGLLNANDLHTHHISRPIDVVELVICIMDVQPKKKERKKGSPLEY